MYGSVLIMAGGRMGVNGVGERLRLFFFMSEAIWSRLPSVCITYCTIAICRSTRSPLMYANLLPATLVARSLSIRSCISAICQCVRGVNPKCGFTPHSFVTRFSSSECPTGTSGSGTFGISRSSAVISGSTSERLISNAFNSSLMRLPSRRAASGFDLPSFASSLREVLSVCSCLLSSRICESSSSTRSILTDRLLFVAASRYICGFCRR